MSVKAIAKRFVELCNQGKNFDVMREMYSDDIVSVEGGGKETAGKEAVIRKSEVWASGLTLHGEKVLGPYYNLAADTKDQFAVHFTFDITPKSTGKRISQDEVAIYTVKDGKIVREQFFYEEGW